MSGPGEQPRAYPCLPRGASGDAQIAGRTLGDRFAGRGARGRAGGPSLTTPPPRTRPRARWRGRPPARPRRPGEPARPRRRAASRRDVGTARRTPTRPTAITTTTASIPASDLTRPSLSQRRTRSGASTRRTRRRYPAGRGRHGAGRAGRCGGRTCRREGRPAGAPLGRRRGHSRPTTRALSPRPPLLLGTPTSSVRRSLSLGSKVYVITFPYSPR